MRLATKRTVIDYTSIDPFFNFQLGKVCHNAANTPLEEHVHPNALELTYFVRGEQVYTVHATPYTVKSGEVFLTLPNERHSSGHYPKDKSQFYYLIIDQAFLRQLLFNESESLTLLNALMHIEPRSFKVNTSLTADFEALLACGLDSSPYHKTSISLLLSHILLQLVQAKTHCSPHPAVPMQEVLEYIQHHLEEPISLSQLARIANLSEGRFKTKFKHYVGTPPREYILREKVKQAKALLENSDLTITQISYHLGFSSSQYFSTVFKRFTSTSPLDYRHQHVMD